MHIGFIVGMLNITPPGIMSDSIGIVVNPVRMILVLELVKVRCLESKRHAERGDVSCLSNRNNVNS